jgi:hypothetical protein
VSTAPCWRCKLRQVAVCYMADARTSAEFLGMHEPCYDEWLSQFPSYPPCEVTA